GRLSLGEGPAQEGRLLVGALPPPAGRAGAGADRRGGRGRGSAARAVARPGRVRRARGRPNGGRPCPGGEHRAWLAGRTSAAALLSRPRSAPDGAATPAVRPLRGGALSRAVATIGTRADGAIRRAL